MLRYADWGCVQMHDLYLLSSSSWLFLSSAALSLTVLLSLDRQRS